MANTETVIHLAQQFFGEQEKFLVKQGELTASLFRFSSGVCGLRLANAKGQLVVLPFQGQQVWSDEFGGRNLTMKSMFTEPQPTRDFLATFGSFLSHCGATAMGVPGANDTHPLHGELPNAPYREVFISFGDDERGHYMGVSGKYQHTVAFNYNYVAQPLLKLYAGSSLFHLSMTITNLKNSPMELMYLAHINFRPVDNGRLVYSAIPSPEHMRVRANLPSFIQLRPGYKEFVEELRLHPEKHQVLAPGLVFDPEMVFSIDYLADEQGWAHALQIHPDQTADYVRHHPAQLSKGNRWICRTADQDALGFEPATAEVDGYTSEKAKGNLQVIQPHGEFYCEIEIGVLDPAAARRVEENVARLVSLHRTD